MIKSSMHKARGMTFVTLPYSLRKPINGGCSCDYCKDHPNATPAWDTVATDGIDSWTIHYPEMWHC
jgi:hypothetical protein